MPSFEHNGASIYYEEFGQGFPILTFAPAGLQSVIGVWSQASAPVNPLGIKLTGFEYGNRSFMYHRDIPSM